MAHRIDPSRCVAGIATCFGVPTRDGQKPWTVEHFDLVLGLQEPVPLRIDHGPLIHSWGLTDNIGAVEGYAAIDYPVSGVLILAEVGEAYAVGDSVLRDIQKSLSFEYFDPSWHFSVGGFWDGEDSVILNEISLTKNPAYRDARVLAVGSEAIETFNMLTETRRAAA